MFASDFRIQNFEVYLIDYDYLSAQGISFEQCFWTPRSEAEKRYVNQLNLGPTHFD